MSTSYLVELSKEAKDIIGQSDNQLCSCLPGENFISWYDENDNWHYSTITDLVKKK